MWRADRDSTTARTDEDRAMAHVCYGIWYADRDDARAALIAAIKDEIRHFLDGQTGYFSARCVVRLATILGELLDNPDHMAAEYDGLRFGIMEWQELEGGIAGC